jgi:hypothetical protein
MPLENKTLASLFSRSHRKTTQLMVIFVAREQYEEGLDFLVPLVFIYNM